MNQPKTVAPEVDTFKKASKPKHQVNKTAT